MITRKREQRQPIVIESRGAAVTIVLVAIAFAVALLWNTPSKQLGQPAAADSTQQHSTP